MGEVVGGPLFTLAALVVVAGGVAAIVAGVRALWRRLRRR